MRNGVGHPPPFQRWVRTVDKGHRLRLPKDLALMLSWLSVDSERVDCVCTVGAVGGIRIVPATLVEPTRRSLEARISGKVASPRDGGSAWLALARYLATTWVVPVAIEESRFTLTLPEDVRKLGLAPNQGEVAIAFAVTDILEIWRAESWCEHVRESASSIDDLKINALEALSGSDDTP
jgi:hypothetical protein